MREWMGMEGIRGWMGDGGYEGMEGVRGWRG
jgi:hypothetical protein